MHQQPRSLGATILQRRREQDLSQEQLAQRSGVSSKAISRIEGGVTADPGFADAVQLAVALGLSPNQLAERAGLWHRDPTDVEHPQWRWVLEFLRRATPKQQARLLEAAYLVGLGLEHDRPKFNPDSGD